MGETDGRLLARGPGGIRIVECPCKKHYHVRVGNTSITLSRQEFLSLVRTATRAGRRLDKSGGLHLESREFWPIQ